MKTFFLVFVDIFSGNGSRKLRPFLFKFLGTPLLLYGGFAAAVASVRPVSSVFERFAISEGGLVFDSRTGRIGSRVANGTPPLFCPFLRSCVVQAPSRGNRAANR